MDFVQDQYLQYKSQYDNATKLYRYAAKWGGPVVNKILALAQKSLVTQPDLTSVALLLVLLYISFVFLVRAWRLTIGTIMFSIKATVISFIGVCLLGVYNSIVNGDSSILVAIWSTSTKIYKTALSLTLENDSNQGTKQARSFWKQ